MCRVVNWRRVHHGLLWEALYADVGGGVRREAFDEGVRREAVEKSVRREA
jgi:hypothetical protein